MTDEEILRRDVDLGADCHLDAASKDKLWQIVKANRAAFSLYGEIGDSGHQVKLHLTDDQPFSIRPYTVSEAKKAIIDRELDKLVKMGVLEQGLAKCSSPVMLVAKKGTDAKRVVSDLRHLNSKIRRQNWPFPLVRDTIQKLGMSGCSVISTLDLKDAFYCLHLDEESQQYAGITSYYGGHSYYYKRLPMGSLVSPSEFQMVLERVLDTIPGARDFVIAHMDDLIVFSRNNSDHLRHVELLLRALAEHGLKLSPKKAKFCHSSLEYMGHQIFDH